MELTPIFEPGLVASTIASAVGSQEAGGHSLVDRLKLFLRDKQMLLVLDNFEQLLDAAPLVVGLLSTCPGLRVVVTSREALHIPGEQQLPVPPLEVPDLTRLPDAQTLVSCPSVALFVQRASAVDPGFRLLPENSRLVAAICTRLEGLPLAIELAAARIKTLTPRDLLSHLDRQLKLLTGGSRHLPARLQTLRGAIDWSYHLLSPTEQTLFCCMSIFAGAASLPAIQIVCDLNAQADIPGVLERVGSLMDKNLLQRKVGPEGESRFSMPVIIQEFAREKLEESGEADAVQYKHARFFMTLAEEAGPELWGKNQATLLARLEEDVDNLRAALGWSLEQGEAEAVARTASALGRFWYIHSRPSEGRKWLEQAIAADSQLPVAVYAEALATLGYLAANQGDHESAKSALEQSAALFRELGDKLAAARALNFLGVALISDGNHQQALSVWEESLYLRREARDETGIAQSLMNIGSTLSNHAGKYAPADTMLLEALDLWRKLGDEIGMAFTTRELGLTALGQGDCARARPYFNESLRLYRELGSKLGIVECLVGMARLAQREHAVTRAARLFGAAEAVKGTIELPAWTSFEYNRSVSFARAQLEDVNWEEWWREGLAMSIEQAIKYALEEMNTLDP